LRLGLQGEEGEEEEDQDQAEVQEKEDQGEGESEEGKLLFHLELASWIADDIVKDERV